MKPIHGNKLFLQFIFAVVFTGVFCSCTKDVSQDPRYNYGFKYNHVYKMIDETLLLKESHLKSYYALHQMSEVDKQNRDNYLSPQNRFILLPKGTLFRVEQLIRNINPEQSTLLVKVRILNGHFKNIQAICFLKIDKYTDPIERKKSSKELGVPIEIPDPAVVIDLGEMPEYKDEKSIPEPEPITYTP